jgi:hypothetical protein
VLILVKPRDRYDQCDIPALEHACMTFAAGKGLYERNLNGAELRFALSAIGSARMNA